MSTNFAYELQIVVTEFEGGLVNDINYHSIVVTLWCGEVFQQTDVRGAINAHRYIEELCNYLMVWYGIL